MEYLRAQVFFLITRSPRRGETFVTKKIVKGLAEIKYGKKKKSLGNLDAKRDWGHVQKTMLRRCGG